MADHTPGIDGLLASVSELVADLAGSQLSPELDAQLGNYAGALQGLRTRHAECTLSLAVLAMTKSGGWGVGVGVGLWSCC